MGGVAMEEKMHKTQRSFVFPMLYDSLTVTKWKRRKCVIKNNKSRRNYIKFTTRGLTNLNKIIRKFNVWTQFQQHRKQTLTITSEKLNYNWN